jgi:hypothetical protein
MPRTRFYPQTRTTRDANRISAPHKLLAGQRAARMAQETREQRHLARREHNLAPGERHPMRRESSVSAPAESTLSSRQRRRARILAANSSIENGFVT